MRACFRAPIRMCRGIRCLLREETERRCWVDTTATPMNVVADRDDDDEDDDGDDSDHNDHDDDDDG